MSRYNKKKNINWILWVGLIALSIGLAVPFVIKKNGVKLFDVYKMKVKNYFNKKSYI